MNSRTSIVAVLCLLLGFGAGAFAGHRFAAPAAVPSGDAARSADTPRTGSGATPADAEDASSSPAPRVRPSPFALAEERSSTPTPDAPPPIDRAGSSAPPTLASGIPTSLDRLRDPAVLAATLVSLTKADGAALGTFAERLLDDAAGARTGDPDAVPVLLVRTAFARWARLDAEAALAWIERRAAVTDPYEDDAGALLREAIGSVATASPGRAGGRLGDALDERWRDVVVEATAGAAAETDPRAALASFDAGAPDDGGEWALVERWVRHDPRDALDWLAREASADERSRHAWTILDGAFAADPGRALALLATLDDPMLAAEFTARHAGELAAADPANALAFADSLGTAAERERALEEIGMRWASSDVDGLLTRLRTDPDARDRASLLAWSAHEVAATLAGRDVDAGMAWSASLSDEERALLEPALFLEWSSSDDEAAYAWFAARTTTLDPALDAALLDAALPGLAAHDPDGALALYPTLGERRQRELAGPVVRALARTRPAEAERWADALEDPTARERARLSLQAEAASLDPVAWLDASLGLDADVRAERLVALWDGELAPGQDALVTEWLARHPPTPADERALERRYEALYGGDC